MSQSEREYAQALFELSVEENATKQYQSALDTIDELLKDNPDYIELLACPATPLDERLSAIEQAFGASMPEYIVFFLKILCQNAKIRSLPACINEFRTMASAYSDTSVANIYSAIPLSAKQQQDICKKLEKLTNKSIEPNYIINESLIGGLKIEIDSKTFDGSIAHRLEQIKDVMNS